MNKPAKLENGFESLGKVTLKAGEKVVIDFSAKGAGGFVHIDAVQLFPLSATQK